MQTSGASRRENAESHPPVMPAWAGIQYSEASTMESRTRGVLDNPPEPVIGRAFARPDGRV
jgi:hypothetical protein